MLKVIKPIDLLLKKAIELSSPFKNGGGTLYSSYHLPNLEYTNSQRNTLVRLRMFGIKDDDTFKNKTILDLGSNTGAMSFEFAKRGAKVLGLEYNQERVDLCNQIAKHFKLNAEFRRLDLNQKTIKESFDIILAMAIDHYIDNKEEFYKFICNHTKEMCLYEVNDTKFNIDKFKNAFSQMKINYIGTSAHKTDSSKGKPRKLFILGKDKYIYLRGYIEKEGELYVKTYYSEDEWNKIKNIYNDIKNIKQVPYMDFSKHKKIITKAIDGLNLHEARLTTEEKEHYKQELLDFIANLNKRGYAHRDLSVKNIIVGSQLLFVIDWDYVTENKVQLKESYDLTGQGLESPALTNNTNIFKKFIRFKSVAEVLNITSKDVF